MSPNAENKHYRFEYDRNFFDPLPSTAFIARRSCNEESFEVSSIL